MAESPNLADPKNSNNNCSHCQTLRSENEKLQIYKTKRQEMDAAEKQGKAAGLAGQAAENNPFPTNDPCHLSWEYGRTFQEYETRFGEVFGLLLWIYPNLEIFQELAAGYGFEELKFKIETVRDKVWPFVAGYLQQDDKSHETAA